MKEVKPLFSEPSYAPLIECSYLRIRRRNKGLAHISDPTQFDLILILRTLQIQNFEMLEGVQRTTKLLMGLEHKPGEGAGVIQLEAKEAQGNITF